MKHFTGPRGDVDPFGNGENTQAHRINVAMSTAPQTIKQISAKCKVTNTDRIRNHMKWLVVRGYATQQEQTWALTDSAAIKFNEKKFPFTP